MDIFHNEPCREETNKIPDHFLLGILATLFCCLPFRLLSIYYATKVDASLARGNLPAALEASKSAKGWIFISFFSSLAIYLIMAIVLVFGIFLAP